jgi:hypothetical protein
MKQLSNINIRFKYLAALLVILIMPWISYELSIFIRYKLNIVEVDNKNNRYIAYTFYALTLSMSGGVGLLFNSLVGERFILIGTFFCITCAAAISVLFNDLVSMNESLLHLHIIYPPIFIGSSLIAALVKKNLDIWGSVVFGVSMFYSVFYGFRLWILIFFQ